MKLVLAALVVFGSLASAAFACSPWDLECETLMLDPVGKAVEKAVQDAGKAIEKAAQDVSKAIEKANQIDGSILHPVRRYLREEEIPPTGIAAYGIVALKSRPTAANSKKLMMVCSSFLAHFDRAEGLTLPCLGSDGHHLASKRSRK